MINRIRSIQAMIGPKEAWLISNQVHIEYLTGFVSLLPTEREGFLWLSQDTAALIHASFSPAPTHEDMLYLTGCYTSQLVNHISHLLELEPIEKIVIDGATLWHDEYRALSEANQKNAATIVEQKKHQMSGSGSSFEATNTHSLTHDPIIIARTIKDAIEQQAIAKASEIVAQTVYEVSQTLQPGMTEQYVCQQIEISMRAKGSVQPAFPTIVAFGANSALPHHQPGNTILEQNTAVLIDCGATVDRYKSDMTRSWWFGQDKPAEYEKIESAVLEAYAAGANVLADRFEIHETTLAKKEKSPSEKNSLSEQTADQVTKDSNLTTDAHPSEKQISAALLDGTCRSVIQKAGYGPHFIHTTGHGVGLDIHEAPSISGSNQSALQPGMVITIEPGIYIEDSFGFRYENTVMLS
jgi:Xaa-Pro aminopeptidase